MKNNVKVQDDTQSLQSCVTSSADVDNWLIKFKRSKEGKLFDLKHEFSSLNHRYSPNGRPDINSYSANAMWIVAKGTRFEEDMKYFISILCPDFFKDTGV